MSAAAATKLDFPEGFLWGVATAAYQIEGAALEHGRSPCIWDTFCKQDGKVLNGEDGSVACDHYRRFKEDVRIMKELGVPAYRFSVSWSRLLPAGRGEVNAEGVAFYNALLDELVANGIKPLVTLYHWDLPQCLEDEYKGWLGRQVIDDFEYFASVCFDKFGDRVKDWITINEPWVCTVLGYATGEFAPGRKEQPHTEPYLATHHMILAHAKAVQLYRSRAASQGGRIGITLNMDWKEPLSDKPEEIAAWKRNNDFMLGWYADPIWKGDYPEEMKRLCGERLPAFTDEEKKLIKGTSDFFGLNHYSTSYVYAAEGSAKTTSMWGKEQSGGYFDDMNVESKQDPRWGRTDMDWSIVPWGLRHLLEYVQETWQPPGGILITENGMAVKEPSLEDAVKDSSRVDFYKSYLAQVHAAIKGGVDCRGYFAWSLLDNFEWALGYSKRFGLVRVDYKTLERTVKSSGTMFGEIARTNALTISDDLLEASKYRHIDTGDEVPAWKKAKHA